MKPSKNFYQWDINQKFTECDGMFVDFIINEKVIYRVDIVNGECIIPDEFLQKSGYHTVYECMSDYTIQNHMFPVHPREKPPSYVYTPTEKLTFEGLVQKVNDTVADIIRRADSGEFDGYTPVKGKDYFTEAEKSEMVESVASGAIGEFRKVVDSATADFNENSSVKTNDYNTNAEQKLEAYNSNHTEKLTEYNANAETKTAEFDSNAAALQTEVDRLQGECDQLAEENRKQENRIDALMKLNKGQTYDILPEEGESASRTAPSGAKYVSVDKVGGKSIVWNQLNNPADNINVQKGAIKLNDDGSITISGTVQDAGKYNELQISQSFMFMGKQKYLVRTNKILSICVNGHDKSTTDALLYAGASDWTGYVALGVANGDEVNIKELVVQVYNLTQMFGAGNEPTIEQFKKLFAQKIYPYNSGEIISSTTANVELEGKNLWNDSDPAFTQVLTKAGFTFDGTTWKSNLIDYIAMPITIAKGSTFSYDIKAPAGANVRFKFTMSSGSHIIAKDYLSNGSWKHHSLYLPYDVHTVYIDYSTRKSCEIKNIQLEQGTTETAYSPHKKQSLSTGFPELHSAGTAHDEIDMDGGTIRRSVGVVDLGTLDWTYNSEYKFMLVAVDGKRAGHKNLIISRYNLSPNELWQQDTDGICGGNEQNNIIYVKDLNYSDPAAFKVAIKGVMLHYELATPTTEPVAIPEPLQEWLPVEAGGTVTFQNEDESKQLAVPNAVSWVRKLNEVE